MFDSQVVVSPYMKSLAKKNHNMTDRTYFEECPLFEDMRVKGMLEKLIDNYKHVTTDVIEYIPSFYNGKVIYFKPKVIPSGIKDAQLLYNNEMLKFKAGGYEDFIKKENLEVIYTPHEHDLMMDDESLDIIVPKILEVLR